MMATKSGCSATRGYDTVTQREVAVFRPETPSVLARTPGDSLRSIIVLVQSH